MKLYLCEKPSQAKDIAAVLGVTNRTQSHIETRDGVVTWAIGHLLELASPESYGEQYEKWNFENLPILPTPFLVVGKDTTKSQLKAVGALIKKAKEVVISTDADREGEMIARELLEHFSFKGSVTRLWLSALDPESIKKSLSRVKRGEETASLYHAALARSQSDWLVGMNMTRAVTLRCRKPMEKGVLSIGRVQTPTLALVVRRDREIENFKSRDYFEIVADVLAKNGARVALRFAPRDEDRIFERPVAEAIAAKSRGVTGPISVSKEQKKQAPPKLFALSDFQMKANAMFSWPAAKSLKIAQSLYETHKAATYPRTDCNFLPEEQAVDVPAIVANLLSLPEFKGTQLPNPPLIRKSVFNTAKVTAHHAIIPTTLRPNLAAMSDDERKGFLLIAKSYLAALMPDYEFEQTRISIEAGVTFTATGNVPIKMGWRSLYAQEGSEKSTDLPAIPDKTPGTVEKATVEGKKTEPPSRYTEGTLLADMKAIGKFVTDPAKKARLKETSGIGTEATRANIIATLLVREFLAAKGKQIISMPKGRNLITLLEAHLPQLADPGETAVWEEGLESIVSQTLTLDRFVSAIGDRVKKYIEKLGGAVAAPTGAGSSSSDQPAKPSGQTYQGKPILDGGDRWIFEAVKGTFLKAIAKRPMSITDYIKVLDAQNDAFPSFTDFRSKVNKPFTAKLKYNPKRVFKGTPSPGMEFVFEETASK